MNISFLEKVNYTPYFGANNNSYIDKSLPKKSPVFINKKELPKVFLGSDIVKPYTPKNEFPPITSEDEYNLLFDRIKDEKTFFMELNYWNSYINERKYQNLPQNLKGLTIYAGYGDKSDDINKYLSGRLNYEEAIAESIREYNQRKFSITGSSLPQHKSIYKDMIRVLDYSLKALDDKYGKYEGIVYRKGYMDCNTPQFFSASQSAKLVVEFSQPSDREQYSIIRTKSGHKICDFQEEYGSNFANTEQEILLDRKAKYRIVPPEEYDEEILAAKDNFEYFYLCDTGKIPEIQVFEEI
ncbi:hypothetical protein II906_00405 [bacterium]|nr:hypothetical protein [bacterium]